MYREIFRRSHSRYSLQKEVERSFQQLFSPLLDFNDSHFWYLSPSVKENEQNQTILAWSGIFYPSVEFHIPPFF